MKRKMIILCVGLVLCIAGAGQKIFIGGNETSRKLQWTDFTGMPDNSSPYFALTWWNVNFRYQGVNFEGERAVLSGLEVTVQLNQEKSWVKKGKESEGLLIHEQGHFDLGILCMKEILSSIGKTTFQKNDYEQKIRDIFNEVLNRYKAMGNQYDEETGHGTSNDQQQKWNEWIRQKLKAG